MIRALLALALLWPLSAHAEDDLPCPPKSYFCWQAKLAFSKYGAARVIAKAKACGWSVDEIAEARKCK